MAHQPLAGARGQGESPPLSAPGGDTIAAVATPPGRGGIGIVRVSGPASRAVARAIAGEEPQPRHARFARFLDAEGALIDEGIALFFPAPHSYTGEDVLELQGHGGPYVMHCLLQRCIALGARLAEPGEFTRRAFLNDRMDLAQAEGVADLIDASSVEAARSAVRSMAGEFSRRIRAIADGLTELRAHVEACIDFPEEEIEPEDRRMQAARLDALLTATQALLEVARQGLVLREGLTVALVGRPNVGKSSLLNRLAGEDLAIVTPIPGTTRDHVRATIELQGVAIHLIDTAGLRETRDEVERLGVERTWQALEGAGAAMFITEAGRGAPAEDDAILARLPDAIRIARVENKIDLAGIEPSAGRTGDVTTLRVSAKSGAGLEALKAWLLETAGWRPHGEGVFMARARHVAALQSATESLQAATNHSQAFELMAEDLRLAQGALAAITGTVTADALLGEIFARFCIGK